LRAGRGSASPSGGFARARAIRNLQLGIRNAYAGFARSDLGLLISPIFFSVGHGIVHARQGGMLDDEHDRADFEDGQDIRDRAFRFACRVVRFCQALHDRGGVGRMMVPQLLSCSTSVPSMLEEARAAESRRDFISKCCIGLKEAREAHVRLRVCDTRAALVPLMKRAHSGGNRTKLWRSSERSSGTHAAMPASQPRPDRVYEFLIPNP
jgi:four helix bundle protein